MYYMFSKISLVFAIWGSQTTLSSLCLRSFSKEKTASSSSPTWVQKRHRPDATSKKMVHVRNMRMPEHALVVTLPYTVVRVTAGVIAR